MYNAPLVAFFIASQSKINRQQYLHKRNTFYNANNLKNIKQTTIKGKIYIKKEQIQGHLIDLITIFNNVFFYYTINYLMFYM